jgi:hypothetical protein
MSETTDPSATLGMTKEGLALSFGIGSWLREYRPTVVQRFFVIRRPVLRPGPAVFRRGPHFKIRKGVRLQLLQLIKDSSHIVVPSHRLEAFSAVLEGDQNHHLLGVHRPRSTSSVLASRPHSDERLLLSKGPYSSPRWVIPRSSLSPPYLPPMGNPSSSLSPLISPQWVTIRSFLGEVTSFEA